MSRRREKVIHEAWAAAFNTWWNVLDSELYFFFISRAHWFGSSLLAILCAGAVRCNLLNTSLPWEHIPHLWYGFDFSVFIIPAAAAAQQQEMRFEKQLTIACSSWYAAHAICDCGQDVLVLAMRDNWTCECEELRVPLLYFVTQVLQKVCELIVTVYAPPFFSFHFFH